MEAPIATPNTVLLSVDKRGVPCSGILNTAATKQAPIDPNRKGKGALKIFKTTPVMSAIANVIN